MKSKIIITALPLSLFVLLILLSQLDKPVWLVDFKRMYNSSLLEPLEILSLALIISALLLITQKIHILRSWLKYVLSWFLPLTVLVVASGTDGAQFGWMPKTTLAQIMGASLVLITVVFIAIQTFKLKHPKNKQ